MQFLSDQELVSALANLIIRSQSPYTQDKQQTQSTLISWSHGQEGMQSKIEILHMSKKQVTVDCVHELFRIDPSMANSDVQHEIQEFNDMMDRVMLPAFLWRNAAKGMLELHWQETMKSELDMRVAQKMFEQSGLLRNSLEKRLRFKFTGELSQKNLH